MRLLEIHRAYEGNFISTYVLKYLTDKGIKRYEMNSRQGTRHFGGELTPETLGNSNPTSITLICFNKSRDKVLILTEFRLGINKFVHNFVTGFIDEGETIEQAAARELKEETDLDLISIDEVLPPDYICAPICDDKTSLVVCTADGIPKHIVDSNEDTNPMWVDKHKAKEILRAGKFSCSGRVSTFLYTWAVLGNKR